MTWTDPIVDEIRRIRDEHAARFNYDLDAIYQDIKEQEKRSGLKFVSFDRNGNVISSIPETAAPPVPAGSEDVPAWAGNSLAGS